MGADRAAATRAAAEPVIFINSSTFDDTLSAALASGSDVVVVNMVGNVTLNTFPERLDRWLAATKAQGGQVAQHPLQDPGAPAGQSRFLGGVVELAVKVFDWTRQKALYAPAGAHDARVEYERGTGVVRTVRFVRRQPVAVR